MKRIVSIVSAFALLLSLSSCGETDDGGYARLINHWLNVTEEGAFFTTMDLYPPLCYCDFETMEVTYVCSEPGCDHSDESACSAYGLDHHPTLYNGSICCFGLESVTVSEGNIVFTTTAYKSDTDGTNRETLDTLSGLRYWRWETSLIKGDQIYFPAEYFADWSGGESELHLCSFSFSDETFTDYGTVLSGFGIVTELYGEYDGKFVFTVTYCADKDSYRVVCDGDETSGDSSEPSGYAASEEYRTVVYGFDYENTTLEELSLPEPLAVGDGYYVYISDGKMTILGEDGSEKTIDSVKFGDMDKGTAGLSDAFCNSPFISELARFSDWVSYEDGTAYVFLLRDTLLPYIYYLGKGRTRIHPWLLGRSALELVSGVKNLDDELRKPVYTALENGVSDFDEFKSAVLPEMRRTVSKYPKLENFLLNLLGDIKEQKIVAVEAGVCGTFPLVLMSLDSRVDFRMYTTYPYLLDLYKGRVSIDEYEKSHEFESLCSHDMLLELSDIRDGKFYVKTCETSAVLEEALREIGAIMKA